MLKCLIALTSLFPAAVLAATVWTWVDAQGRRHYSDQQVSGATAIEVGSTTPASPRPPPSASTSARTSPADASSGADAEPATPRSYSVLDIVSPEPEQSLWNIGAELPVKLATNPALAPGDRIDAILDGQRVELNARSLDLTVPDVFRGEHTLALIIVDAKGNELKRSAAVKFYVHQTSILKAP